MAHDPTLLLTRPRAASERFSAQVQAALGPVDIMITPLMEIAFQPVPPEAAAARTVLFTSMHGVSAWQRSGLPCTAACVCVGPATAQAARKLGFAAQASGGSLDQMLPQVLASDLPEPFAHIHGFHSLGDLAGALRDAGRDAQGYAVYDQRLLPLPGAARALLTGPAPVIVPLFSPRSAAHFAKVCPWTGRPYVVAISQNAALHWPGAMVAERPDAEAMVAAIAKTFGRMRSA